MSTSDVSESNPTSNATSQRSSPETPSARSLQVNVSKVLNVQTTREEGAWVTFTVDFCGTTSPPSGKELSSFSPPPTIFVVILHFASFFL